MVVTSCNSKRAVGSGVAVWHQGDSATTVEHVIPCHTHHLRIGVCCWVCAEAVSGELKQKPVSVLCGGGFKFPHHSPGSHGRQQEENQVPGGITATVFLGEIKLGTWLFRFGGVSNLKQSCRTWT
jgi:hypothetical protein